MPTVRSKWGAVHNLIITAEGGELVVDDNGNPVAPGDTGKVNAAWQLMGSIGFARADGAISGDLSLENLPDVLKRFGTANLDEKRVRSMLNDFMAALGASAEDISRLQSSSQIGHEGEQIITWNWQRAPTMSETESASTASIEASDFAERLRYLST